MAVVGGEQARGAKHTSQSGKGRPC
jgi:hypothetical protein